MALRRVVIDTTAMESEMPLLFTLTTVLVLSIYDGQISRLESVLFATQLRALCRVLDNNNGAFTIM